MEDKTYIVRISSQFNTEADWLALDPVLLVGEIAFVSSKSDLPNALPEIRIKSGDGIHKFSELPYTSANASDVYNWAKQKNKPTYHADEIIGLKKFMVEDHTHTIDDVIGLREILENRSELPDKEEDGDDSSNNDGSSDDGSSDDGDDSSNDEVVKIGKILANNEDGLYAIQDGDDYIIGINDKITFTLDGGDSSQFQS
jgi:hypothetical protein